jgi:hypothetical protein
MRVLGVGVVRWSTSPLSGGERLARFVQASLFPAKDDEADRDDRVTVAPRRLVMVPFNFFKPFFPRD